MDRHRRELLVSRVLSGCVRVSVPGPGGPRAFTVRRPGREESYAACELYEESLREGELEGLYSEADLLGFLLEHGLWDRERQALLESLPKEIDQFKLRLFKAAFKGSERAAVRKALAVAKARLEELHAERHAYDHLSAAGAAAAAKARFLLACSLHGPDGRRAFPSPEAFWADGSRLLDGVMSEWSRLRLAEADYRELARTDPWRPLWAAHRSEGRLFGVAPADYTDEQVSLASWSSTYDSVYAHPECPPDAAVEDDDLLDGWMLDQRARRDDRLARSEGDGQVTNAKIAGSQEVYLVAETPEDARKVVGLNDEVSRAVQKQRFDALARKGEVNELDMPDTRQRLRTEMTRKLSAAMASSRG